MNNAAQTFIVITIIIIFILVVIFIYYRNIALEDSTSYVTFRVKHDDGYYRYYKLSSEYIPLMEHVSGHLYIFFDDGINGMRKIKLYDQDGMDSCYKYRGPDAVTVVTNEAEENFLKQLRYHYVNNKTKEYSVCDYYFEIGKL